MCAFGAKGASWPIQGLGWRACAPLPSSTSTGTGGRLLSWPYPMQLWLAQAPTSGEFHKSLAAGQKLPVLPPVARRGSTQTKGNCYLCTWQGADRGGGMLTTVGLGPCRSGWHQERQPQTALPLKGLNTGTFRRKVRKFWSSRRGVAWISAPLRPYQSPSEGRGGQYRQHGRTPRLFLGGVTMAAYLHSARCLACALY